MSMDDAKKSKQNDENKIAYEWKRLSSIWNIVTPANTFVFFSVS